MQAHNRGTFAPIERVTMKRTSRNRSGFHRTMQQKPLVSASAMDRMANMFRLGLVVMVLGVAAGCTERVNVCNMDSDCKNPAFPFCDVNGEYDESGHEKNSCSIEPASCPVERCGCTPGAVTCEGETRTSCNTDGKSVTTETCSLGCAADGQRCHTFDPSNGLTGQLMNSSGSADVSLPDGTTIDTTTGVVKLSGVPMNVDSATVLQAGGPMIRVLLARSWMVGNVRVTGSMPLALVSVGDISINGLLDASAKDSGPAPGGVTTPNACVGGDSPGGGGGGGNLTVGGNSLSTGVIGPNGPIKGMGGAIAGLTPFVGGCSGGAFIDGSPPQSHDNGGRGGGAVQLVSLGTIAISGTVNVGGGGGLTVNGGGGSGGNVLLEAPSVSITGGVFANGGSGAACGLGGRDGLLSLQVAVAPSCQVGTQTVHGGNGGTLNMPAGSAGNVSNGSSAGGGGAVGRVRIATRTGAAEIFPLTISAGIEQVMLNPR